jgi:ureidoacrylate peracid hydrolase
MDRKNKKRNIISITPAILIIDVQNCFMSYGGSFDRMNFNIKEYQCVIEPLKKIIKKARTFNIPLFFSRAIREASGVDLLDRVHKIIPANRAERIKRFPLCVRGTWDGDLIGNIGINFQKDYILEKRRDSVFYGTELEIWLKALKIDTLVFAGVDAAICVESTLRDAFNIGYDVILLSDATASHSKKFYNSTLEEVKENFGLVMESKDFFSRVKKRNGSFTFEL